MSSKPRILVAMSGGVDSSTVAALLAEQAESDLVGVTMKVWEDENNLERKPGACCALDDTDDARRVANAMGIPHYTLNVKAEFREKVVDYFIAEYLTGRTPNPCILCNQVVKFDYLFAKGATFGATKVATGHYARIGNLWGQPTLMRGCDTEKDQSYFLFSTPSARLPDILFPLGEYSKSETRRMAERFNLPVAQKRESQEICFIPDDDYGGLLKREGAEVAPGDIVDASGTVRGRHKGYPFYTVGQRKGLGIAHRTPLYVTAIDALNNVVHVGERGELYGTTMLLSKMNWFLPVEEACKLDLTCRLRHRHADAPASIKNVEDGVVVTFAEPQLSIAPGQAAVLYHGEHVVGGGWIERRIH